jgi:hypothetical protein
MSEVGTPQDIESRSSAPRFYALTDPRDGHCIGRYQARNAHEALDLFARIEGFSSFRTACLAIPGLEHCLQLVEL